MKAPRIWAAVVLVTSVVAGGQGAASAREARTIPALAGTTKIVGSESAWMHVRLQREIAARNVSYTFEGNGRAISFYLVRERDGRVPKRPAFIEGERFGECFEEACEPSPLAGYGGSASNRARPGLYRLYLVTDGAPVTITLSIDELAGETTLAPDTPANALVQTLTTRTMSEPTHSSSSAGDVAPFRGRGFAMMLQWLDPNGQGSATFGSCVYDEAPPDQTTAYLPRRCPSPFSDNVKGYEEDDGGFGALYVLSRIPAALGSWYAATTDVETQGSVALWLKF